MTTTHKISFSILDILDPNKFNSKRIAGLCGGKEPLPVVDEESLGPSSNEHGDGTKPRQEGKSKNFEPHNLTLTQGSLG